MTEINLDEEIDRLEKDDLIVKIKPISKKQILIKKQQSELEVLEKYINDIPLVLDPCRLCENKKQNEYQVVCRECMYYYGSNFKVKRLLEKEIKGANNE